MITFRHKGNFSRLTAYLEKAKQAARITVLDKYAREGVAALASATPVDTGKTADSWKYSIERKPGYVALHFENSNIVNYVPIAIILEYGHATRNGGWVEGREYIEPAIRPIFDKIAESAWREVTKL